ncbi:hypothetical protein JG687_00012719 [Phytophthora cactorum]|uniref:Helitron helicase-like domain-containing protein n=1 Tax=Phytophthora cactorum TaxID=29920 RepID=A0A8T1U110_9STRA|nr:hypothetical protein JG687_00012719 [Phytophthora cactorum]
MPSKAKLREASLGNDCASVHLFMRQIDAFIKFALGMDPITRKRLPLRGLFGDVKAYFGMVETQGRGTLHIQFLIWLNRCPPNSAAVESLLESADSESFREQVVSYAQNSARKDPQAGIRATSVRESVAEPPLIKCSACNAQFISQHIRRNALLKFRPDYRPIKTEAPCRNSDAQAASIVRDRDINDVHLSGNPLFCGDVHLATDILEQTNSVRMTVCKSKDNPFRNAEVTRRMEILPPSVSDSKMDRTLLDRLVSALAVLLNQHLWSHTKSCFKQSTTTTNASFCRYHFPRDRADTTSFGPAGVELKRTLGHEFMNGFNDELMATFKCNHDIRILLGGSDVADRIHHWCKREEREKNESSTLGNQDGFTLARKRVAGMVYNMTNRQKIAGPLAALYLLPGIMLLLELLVNASADQDEPKFQAVSFLDDYIFRPDELENANLYEFTMWYFRSRNDNRSSKLGFIDGHPLQSTHRLGKSISELPTISLATPTAPTKIHGLTYLKAGQTRVVKFVIVIMDNMNDYYSGLQKAEVQSKAAKAAQPKNDGDDGSSSDDNDDLFGAGENIDFDDDIERARDDDEEFILMWEENNDASTVLNKNGFLDSVVKELAHGSQSTWPNDGVSSVDLMKKWVHDVRTDNALVAPVSSTVSTSRDTEVVELLGDVMLPGNLEWKPPPAPNVLANTMCTSSHVLAAPSEAETIVVAHTLIIVNAWHQLWLVKLVTFVARHVQICVHANVGA